MRNNQESVWMLQTKRADFNAIAARFHISPVTARIIRNRDVEGEKAIDRYLNGTLDQLYDPHLMKDMDKAAALILEKIRASVRIRIVGDYDIDGVCSTYLLYRGLTRCGAVVDYQIPERIRDGYGINESIIRKAKKDGIDTIVTCDNGIAALEQVRLAKELGMTVIVTDHHEVVRDEDGSQVLPEADAVVNPHRDDCTYPFAGICGGVVAYKLVQVLYEKNGIPEQEWKDMLEFAAIATVGDVMKLQDENRIIVRWGLKQIPHTASVGLRALVEACGLDIYDLTAYHIGFVIGPCLNASGRLKTAKLALELLLCEGMQQSARAEEMAAELKLLNEERKDMTQAGMEQAFEQVDAELADDDVLVVYLPDCHESLAGIIAGRVRENYNKPSFVLTRGEDCVKGSGRSIESYHMYQALCGVQDLLLKFGGHPMAAGFSLKEENIDEFRRRLNEQSALTKEDFIPKIWIDVAMPLEYISEALVNELKGLEPFGQGNEKPQFAQKNLRIRSVRAIGRNNNAVRMTVVTEQGRSMEAMVFTVADQFVEEAKQSRSIDVIYYPDINEYNGNRTLQIVVRAYKLHS
ncbi:single-stranded-DNA-specific exonuclease RecJ [Lacrimispora indolis]|uniref:single-stranded-DNA-specific exonuclease RecJ n=1 Tax=Lacrimispora indolis TaxID=69825 RepID=UPI003568BB98